MSWLLVIFFLFFFILCFRNLKWGLFLIVAFPYSYLIRFSIGQLPLTMLEVMILLTFIVWLIKQSKIIFNIKYLILNLKQHKDWFFVIILFLLAATISVFISPNTRAALGIWKAYFIEPVLFFLVFISIIKTIEDKNKVIWALVLGSLPVALWAFVQKFTGWGIPNIFWQAEATRRVTSFLGYPNAVALYLAPLLPLNIYLLIKTFFQNKNIKIFNIQYLIFNILISLAAIIFAQSTGALMALAITAFFVLLIYKKTRWWAVGLVIAILILVPLTPLREPVDQEVLLKGVSGQLRINMWGETVEMLRSHFWLGAGLSGYQISVAPYHILKWAEIYLYPHNLFLNFWSEIGLLGLVSFLLIVWNFYKIGFRKIGYWILDIGYLKPTKTEKQFIIALLAAMSIIFIHGLVDVPYFKNDLAVVFWILLGLVV